MSHNALQSKVSASRLQRGASGERKTTEALARLHSARSFNHSHCFTAEGWGSLLTPLGLRSSDDDNHVCLQLLREDDGNWFEVGRPFSSFWLRDLIYVLKEAEKAVNSCPEDHTYGRKFC